MERTCGSWLSSIAGDSIVSKSSGIAGIPTNIRVVYTCLASYCLSGFQG